MNHRGCAVRKSPRRTGFTLIELLIVIAILLALGGIVLVSYINVQERADKNIQTVQFDSLDDALKRFRLDMKRWPSEDEGLAALWNREVLEEEDDMAKWGGPYLEEPILEDAWGNELVYRFPGELRGESFYDLISFGPDGEEDTEDDITNHDRLRGEDGEIDTEEFTPAETDPAG